MVKADDVIVMLEIVDKFICFETCVKVHAFNHAGIFEEGESSINRCA